MRAAAIINMNRLVSRFFVFVGASFLCACNGEKSIDFPISFEATADTIRINEITVFDKIVNDGKFLYATSSVTDTTLFVYHLPELKFATSCLPRGGGPGEVRYGPMPAYSNTQGVWLLGFEPGEFRHFELHNGQIIANDTIFAGDFITPNDLSITDNRLVSYSAFPTSCSVYNYEAGEKKPSTQYKFSDSDDASSNSSNRAIFASNGTIAAVAFMYIDRIDFLDAKTLNKRFSVGSGHKVDANTSYPIYVNVKATSDNIYALRLLNENKMAYEVYDNCGNGVKRITMPSEQGTFTVDERNNAIIMYNNSTPERFLRISTEE